MKHSAWILTGILLSSLGMGPLAAANSAPTIEQRLSELRSLSETAKQYLLQRPYRKEHHEAYKSYFSSLSRFVHSELENGKMRRELGEVLRSLDLDGVCREAFWTKEELLGLFQGCTINGFFVCPEVVRPSRSLADVFRGRLDSSQQARFSSLTSCLDLIP